MQDLYITGQKGRGKR